MKNIFTSLALILFCVTFATAQETVTIRLNGSGGYKYIECNGETNTSGKLAVTKGSLVKISTTAGIVPPGCGEAQVAEIIKAHNEYAKGDYFITLEPHLQTFSGLNAIAGKEFDNPYKYETQELAFADAAQKIKQIIA